MKRIITAWIVLAMIIGLLANEASAAALNGTEPVIEAASAAASADTASIDSIAAATNGTTVTQGAPCFHLQFRDGICSGYVKNATTVELVPGGDAWYRHVIYNGKDGYISSGYLKVIAEPVVISTPTPAPVPTPAPAPLPANSGSAVIKGNPCFHAAFRDSACPSYLKNGTNVALLLGGDAYYRHINNSGKDGYVSSAYLTVIIEPVALPTPTPSPAELSQKADEVIAYAQSYIGRVKYAFGVNDPQNLLFDCSSFTKFVFASVGIQLVWSSSGQAKQGKPIYNKSDLQKGDLVHFSVDVPGQINHVGIYIGGGKFIHNTTGSLFGVTIGDLNTGWFADRFIVGTRVIS